MYTGYDYEEYCCEYLKKQRYRHISQTPKSGDHGVDIIAVKHGKKYAFQCKYYETKIGNKAVQEAYTGCSFYDCDVPVVITNSTFTPNAVMEAQTLGVKLIENVDIKRKPHYFMRLALAVILVAAVLWVLPDSIVGKLDVWVTGLLENPYVTGIGIAVIAAAAVFGAIYAYRILKKAREDKE
jgi:predicted RecB family endonuclease